MDQHYIPAFSIEDVLLDKDTGAPLSGGKVYFYRDDQPSVLKPVYQLTGTSPNYTFTQMENPVILSSIGTFEDALGNPTIPYFYPYIEVDDVLTLDYYRIVVTSSGDVPQFVRKGQPYIPDAGGDGGTSTAFTNQISNPQFSEVLFDTQTPNHVFNFTSGTTTVEIAPNWDIIVTAGGAATVTVNQYQPVGSLNLITNPGTLLNINSSGVTTLLLRQRIYGAPNLWGAGNISASFVANTTASTAKILKLYYSQSNSSIVNEILVDATIPNSGAYANYAGTIEIPISDSTDTFSNGYVDIFFDIPVSAEFNITSIMLTPTGSTSIEEIAYEQTSSERQADRLFHYWQQPLNFKPIPSLLTGWDFALNPRQFGAAATVNATPAYVLDQTIMASATGNVAITMNASTGAVKAINAGATEAYYFLQYLTGAQAKKIVLSDWSVNVSCSEATTNGNCVCNVYLYRGNAAATVPTLATTIGTIANTGVFTLTATNWTEIPRSNLGLATAPIQIGTTLDQEGIDLGFSGWDITDSAEINDTDKFAIVVTFKTPTATTTINTNSISLVPGSIPTRPAPQTADEVLRECQYYYEKSYPVDVAPGTSPSSDALIFNQGANGDNGSFGPTTTCKFFQRAFGFNYKQVKRVAVTPVFWSTQTSNLPGAVTVSLTAHTSLPSDVGGSTDVNLIPIWTAFSLGTQTVSYFPTGSQINTDLLTVTFSSSTVLASAGWMSLHYTADARLGLVA